MEKEFVLRGFNQEEGELESFFTGNERATALHVAKMWLLKGWMPFLYSRTYNGTFNVLFNYRNAEKKRKAA